MARANGAAARSSYSCGVIRCSQGAGQRPSSASAQAGCAPRRDSRWRALAHRHRVVDPGRGQLGGPAGAERAQVGAPSLGAAGRDQRQPGVGPSVSLSHTTRSGCFDRRLYGGSCAAISRSSRTSASSGWAHSTASTRSAAASISDIRARFSAAVK